MTQDKNKTLKELIASRAGKINGSEGKTLSVIHESDALQAAGQSGTGLRHIYIAALESGIWPVRYLRNAASLSAEDQIKLARSRVAVIGAGGLGANVLMLLARMGIGMLTIADPDVFEESNLNRQLPATTKTLGSYKTEAAQNMLSEVNPAVEVRTFPVRLTRENAADILSEADVVVDALDTVSDRLVLSNACRQAGIPMVHAAIAGFEGQIITVYPEDDGLGLIYGDGGQAPAPETAPEAVMGVPAVTPALMASLQVMETIKILLARGRILRNRMLYADLESSGFQEFSFNPDPNQA